MAKIGTPVPTLRESFDPDRTTLEIDFERVAESPSGQGTISRPESGPESGPESILERCLAALNHAELGKQELAIAIGQQSVSGKLHIRIRDMLSAGLIERTIPDKPTSRFQKYRLTPKGRAALAAMAEKR